MVFRERPTRAPAGSFTYGPFPIRKGRLVGSLGGLAFAVGMAVMAAQVDRLTCTPDGSCVVTRSMGADVGSFPARALRGVRVDDETGSKNAKYGVIVLVLDDGREVRFARTTPARSAATATKIQGGIEGRQPLEVEVRGPWELILLAVALLALSIALARSALDGAGRFRVEVARGGSALVLRRSVLGLPIGVSEVSLEGVVDVEIERAERDDFWRSRAELPTPTGRIILRDRFGAARPVTDRFYPGRAVHLVAASALRAILGLTPARGRVEEELAALPLVTTSLGMRVAYSWLGVTSGMLLGLGAYGVVGLALGLLRGREGPDGWALGFGGGGGALAGVLLVVHLTRPQRPR